MPTGVLYDGDYTVASAISGIDDSSPLARDPKTRVFRQRFCQLAANFTPLALSLSPAASGMTPAVSFTPATGPFLVGESARQDVGAGIVEWDRTWAHIPAAYMEYEEINYAAQSLISKKVPLQGYTGSDGIFHGVWQILTSLTEWSEPLIATITHEFVLGQAKATKNIIFPYRITKLADKGGVAQFYYTGKRGYAATTKPKRWMGDIWDVVNVRVNPGFSGGIVPGYQFAGGESPYPSW